MEHCGTHLSAIIVSPREHTRGRHAHTSRRRARRPRHRCRPFGTAGAPSAKLRPVGPALLFCPECHHAGLLQREAKLKPSLDPFSGQNQRMFLEE